MDNDSTHTDDIFGRDWDYFLRTSADANTAYKGVSFTIRGVKFNRIILKLYDHDDVPSPCNSAYYGYVCNNYSFYTPGTNVIVLNASAPVTVSYLLGQGVAHELQHLCWYANGMEIDGYTDGSGGYYSANETLATLAEYFSDSWRPQQFDIPYDASIMREETCDANSKYDVEKLWIVYMYETFKGNPSDPTDDLVYRWINSSASRTTRMQLSELANQLWDSDFDWVGGSDAGDRFRIVYRNFLAAKFANAPDFATNTKYGIEGLNSYSNLFFFRDNCTYADTSATPMLPVDCPPHSGGYPSGHIGCWNVRILPPSYELTNANENSFVTVPGASGVYTDGDDTADAYDGDGSKDYVNVACGGTDYILFRAGAYYDDGGDHILRLRLYGTAENKRVTS